MVKQLCQITIFLLLFASCHSTQKAEQKGTVKDWRSQYKVQTVLLPNARVVKAYVAETMDQQEKGLSGIKKLETNEGMLFSYTKPTPLRFWMPDTYLNLDIFFMDEDRKVIYIERNVPAHPGRREPPAIYRTATVWAQYVLELESGTDLARSITKDQELKILNQGTK